MTDRSALASLIDALAGARVLVVGDVMLDHFRYGSVDRISPEAPIPVLKLESEESMLGGAGNVVRNLVSLGATARFVTVIGDDADGKQVARLITEQGLDDAPLVDVSRRTTAKSRYVADGQQILRADQEWTTPLADDMRNSLIQAATDAMDGCAAVVLSDYGKGVLNGDVAADIIAAAKKVNLPVIVDPKGTDYGRYKGAALLTPNRREIQAASGLAADSDDDITAACKALMKEAEAAAVLCTRGANGMTLVDGITGVGGVTHLPAEARDVFDVSGAGDTVAAVMAAAMAAGAGLTDAAALANVAAGIVVGKVGTATAHAADLIAALHHRDLSTAEAKIMTTGQALDGIARWRHQGHSIGFTNGCFDLLHPGHVSLLAQARAAADRLIVGLNSDASVARLKGAGRPIQPEASRAAVLASLATVDMVVIFTDDTPEALLEALRPDVLVKGADYSLDQVVGADLVKGYGGKVLLVELEEGHSTTATIARMAK